MIKSDIAQLMNIGSLRKWLSRGLVALVTAVSAGCSLSDGGMTSHVSPDQYLATLSLEHHSINLSTKAPFDTVTLKVAKLMGDGSEASGEVEYSVSDPSISVTDGVLKAESATGKAVVRVKLTHGLITRTDSALVSVVDVVPIQLGEFGIGLEAGDSAKLAAKQSSKAVPLIRKSATGANLSALYVSIWSTDSTVASIVQSSDILTVTPKRAGRVVLYASTYAYGTAWRDSVVFTVGWPITFTVPIYEKFLSGSTTKILDFGYKDIPLGIGACITWVTQSNDLDADIVFDDPAHVAAPIGNICGFSTYDPTIGGNIAPFRIMRWTGGDIDENSTEEEFDAYRKAMFSSRKSRVFSTAGVYPFRSALYGTTGIIRVCDEQNDTTCAPAGIGPWY